MSEKLEQLNQRIAYTDDINKLVYELYGLSEDEIVEGEIALRKAEKVNTKTL